MVECKYHNMPGKRSDLKVVMYTYARFLDVKHLGFEQPWLVTNTKCTSEVKKYAQCMGIRVISWRYPHDECMEKMLMQKPLPHNYTRIINNGHKTKTGKSQHNDGKRHTEQKHELLEIQNKAS